MSGRIRSIKPELNEDAVIAGLDDFAWRLYVSLKTRADDYGNLPGHPAQLRGHTFWARPEVTDEHVAAAIDDLLQARLVVLYAVEGKVFLSITGWADQERVVHPGKPRVPGPSDAGVVRLQSAAQIYGQTVIRETLAPLSRESRETLVLDPITIRGEGTREARTDEATLDPRAHARKSEPHAIPSPPESTESFAESPEESGVFLRPAAVKASPAPENAPEASTPPPASADPFDAPLTFPLASKKADLLLLPRYAAGIERALGEGSRWVDKPFEGQQLLRVLDRFAPELAGLGVKAIGERLEKAAMEFVRATRTDARRKPGYRLDDFENWLGEGGSKHLTRAPKVLAPKPLVKTEPAQEERGCTPEELRRLVREKAPHIAKALYG